MRNMILYKALYKALCKALYKVLYKGCPLYNSYLIPSTPVTIMTSPLLSLLLPILIPSLLNSNKELQQKLTIPSNTNKILNRHLGSTLQLMVHPGFWNAGGLRVLSVSQKLHVEYLFASLPLTQVKCSNPRHGVRRSRE